MSSFCIDFRLTKTLQKKIFSQWEHYFCFPFIQEIFRRGAKSPLVEVSISFKDHKMYIGIIFTIKRIFATIFSELFIINSVSWLWVSNVLIFRRMLLLNESDNIHCYSYWSRIKIKSDKTLSSIAPDSGQKLKYFLLLLHTDIYCGYLFKTPR